MPYTGQPKGPEHYTGGLSNYLISGAGLGAIFYVDGCAGSDTNTGLDPLQPLATPDQITQMVEGKPHSGCSGGREILTAQRFQHFQSALVPGDRRCWIALV